MMTLEELIESGRLQYSVLWALAAVCIGLALADISVAGFGPGTLAMLGAVFAAVTAEYARGDGGHCLGLARWSQ